MTAFPTPCRAPGCHVASNTPYCPSHHRQEGRPSPSKRGYGRTHEKWRLLVLAADPVCHWPVEDVPSLRYKREPLKCLQPATIADHIKPRSLYPELAYEPSNGQGLCTTHHNAKGSEEKRGLYRSTR